MNTIKHKIFLIWMFLASIFFSACTSLPNAKNDETLSSETPQVIVREVTPEPAPTQVECSAQTNNVNILIEITSSNVEVTVTGLQPGENIVLVYEQDQPQHASTLVSQPSVGVGEDGKFEDSRSLRNFKPEQGGMIGEWLVKVIHAHGVTCETFEVPSE